MRNAVQQKEGKYLGAPESPALNTLLATSVMAGGTGWEKDRVASI